jgi:PAS domain S-box-containing protein
MSQTHDADHRLACCDALMGAPVDAADRERSFRTLADNSPDAIARFDTAGRYMFLNTSGAALFGLPSDACIGRTVAELSSALSAAEASNAQLARVMAALQPDTCELMLQPPDGGEGRWFQFKAVPEFGPTGALLSILRVSRDITDRATIDRLAAEREAALAHAEALQAMNEELWAQTEELQAQGEELQSQSEELLAQTEELQAQSDDLAVMHGALQDRQALLEVELAHRQTIERYLVAQSEAMRHLAEGVDPDQTLPRVLARLGGGFGWHVGELWLVHHADQVLRRHHHWHGDRPHLEAFCAAGAQLALPRGVGLPGRVWQDARPMWSQDIVGEPGFVRGEAASAAGLRVAIAYPIMNASEVLGIVAFFGCDPRTPAAEELMLVEAMSSSLGHFIQRKRAKAELRSAHTELEAAFADIAQQARQLEVQNAQLAKLSRLKDEFLSTVSHELRTPLAAIKNAASILHKRSAGPLTENQARFVGMIQAHVARLRGLVDDILDLQKIESGNVQARLADGDLDLTLRTVAESYALMVEARQVSLTIAATPVRARFDAGLVGQVILNLLSNATKFTPPGGAIMLRCWREGGEALVSVTDTGVGIPDHELERIFLKFVQVGDRLTGDAGGTGLGLAICKQLIEDGHGGRIWAESRPGQGSTFTFALPIVE